MGECSQHGEYACECPPTIQNPRVLIGEGSYVLLAFEGANGSAMIADGARAAQAFVQALDGLTGCRDAEAFRATLLDLLMNDLETLELGHEVIDVGTVEP